MQKPEGGRIDDAQGQATTSGNPAASQRCVHTHFHYVHETFDAFLAVAMVLDIGTMHEFMMPMKQCPLNAASSVLAVGNCST